MGLWLKQDDGSLVPVGGGGDAGPHDHDEFAPVEHDHATESISPEIVNIRQGPFPENLVGMPEMAMYDRTGSIQMSNRSNATFKIGPDANWEGKRPVYNGFVIETGLEVYGESASTQPISIIGSGGLYLNGGGDVGTPPVRMGTLMLAGDPQVTGDLTVDGDIHGSNIMLGSDGQKIWGSTNGTNYLKMVVADEWRIEVQPTKVAIKNDLLVKGNLTVDGTINGTLAFGIADGIDTADVLDRAETAAMPAPDEGVATADVESLSVNEVVTALLAKIKELSARIETLEGN
jgi:hypothetical protein